MHDRSVVHKRTRTLARPCTHPTHPPVCIILQDADDIGYEMGGENYDMVQDSDETVDAKLATILGSDKVHYSSLIDQLIFMEDTFV